MYILLGISFSIWPWLAVIAYLRATKRSERTLYLPYAWLLWLSTLLFITAFFLPDIHISTQTDTFQQHFIGGGVVCMLLSIYIQKTLGLRIVLVQRWLLLIATTCTLGVANEMVEFLLTKLVNMNIDGSDVWWDLSANLLGAVMSYALIEIVMFSRK